MNFKKIDIHSHVLPGMDDGSSSVEESLAMLAASKDQGIDVMAATPHFYPEETTVENFLRCRAEAADRLRPFWREDFPLLLPGAEVYYFDGISHVEEVSALCIGETGLLLLEMPFDRWSGRMADETARLQARRDVNVVLAHIERYLRYPGNREMLERLRYAGVRMQCNAGFFLNWRTRRKAVHMLRQGMVQMLGSDCHNMDTRPPRLGEVFQRLGNEELRILEEGMPL